jgi:hypothetical protein
MTNRERGFRFYKSMNFIDTIFSLQDNEYINITQEKIEELRKRGSIRG